MTHRVYDAHHQGANEDKGLILKIHDWRERSWRFIDQCVRGRSTQNITLLFRTVTPRSHRTLAGPWCYLLSHRARTAHSLDARYMLHARYMITRNPDKGGVGEHECRRSSPRKKSVSPLFIVHHLLPLSSLLLPACPPFSLDVLGLRFKPAPARLELGWRALARHRAFSSEWRPPSGLLRDTRKNTPREVV